MFSLIALVICALMLLIVLVNALIGVFSGLKKSIGSVVAVIISAILAAIVTVVLCQPSLPVMDWIMGLISDALISVVPAMAELFAADIVLDIVSVYVSMFTAPFVFVLFYVIISIVLSIVMAIVIKKIPILQKCPKAANSWGGLGVGIACGILVAVLCAFPFVGVVDIANNVWCETYEDLMEVDGFEEMLNELPIEIGANENAMKPFNYVGCGILYNAFSTTFYNGDVVNLKQEVNALIDVTGGLIEITESDEALGEEQMENVRGMVSAIDRSPILKNLIAEVLHVVVEEGYLDEMGLDFGELMNPVVDAIVEVLKTTTKDTVTEDLNTFVNVFAIIVESDIMNESDSQAILNKIGDGLVSDLLVEINKNERMYPVADEITNLSIRALASALGIPENADERYDDLMNKIANAINETAYYDEEARFESLSNKLDGIFADYGVDVSGAALNNVTEGLIEDMGNGATANSVKEFFMIYHYASNKSETSGGAENGFENLSSSTEKGIVVNSNGTVSVNGVVLEYYRAYNYKSSKAYIFGAGEVEFGGADTLYSAETVKSSILTADDLLASLGRYGDCADVIKESQKVGDIFKTITDMLADKDLDDLDGVEMFDKMGPIFDKMQDSEIFKSESAKNMLIAILQSEKIADVLGLSLKDMTDFANKINNYAVGRENGYEDATKAISGTVNAVSKASDKNASEEEKVAATKVMIDNVSKDNAEMVSSMLTDSMIDKFGTDTGNTTNAADAVKNLIYNMADYKEESPSDESVEKEAEAVTKLINFATTGAGDGPMFDTEDGQKGSLASDPDSFISTVVESDVVMKTVNQSVENEESGSNPYGITYSSEEEKESVASALEKYYAENEGDEELAAKLANLAIVMDVEVSFN